jgi:hypothetical protein
LYIDLKEPKREIFVNEFFTLSDPIWVGDLVTCFILAMTDSSAKIVLRTVSNC